MVFSVPVLNDGLEWSPPSSIQSNIYPHIPVEIMQEIWVKCSKTTSGTDKEGILW